MRKIALALLVLLLPVVSSAQINNHPGPAPSLDWSLSSPLIWDEFIGGNNTSANIGSLGWGLIGSGVVQAPGVANHPGIYQFACAAATTTGVGLPTANPVIMPSNVAEVYGIARWQDVANKPDNRFGITTSATNPPAQGAYFEKLAADTNWFAVTKNVGGDSTRTDTGIAFGSSTWYRLGIRHPTAESWTFYINDVLVATNTLTLPAENTVAYAFFTISGTGTAANMDVDYFRMTMSLTR